MRWVASCAVLVLLAGCAAKGGGAESGDGPGDDRPTDAGQALPETPDQGDDVAADVGEDVTDAEGDEPGESEPGAGNGAPVRSVQEATWLVVYGSDYTLGTATAFGTGPHLLATNAHVVEDILATMKEPNPGAVAFQHETGETRIVTTVWAHPEFDAEGLVVTPDVGLLGVEDELPSSLELADAGTLHSLEVFDGVSLCGFPGDVTAGIDFVGLTTGTV